MLKLGADVNHEDQSGRTPLFYTLLTGKLDLTKFLMTKGADINKVNQYGKTILSWAISNGQVDLAKSVVRLGANVSQEDHRARTALYLAIAAGQIELAEFLAVYMTATNSSNIYNQRILFWAIENRQAKIAEPLIRNRVAINQVDSEGRSILHYAVECGNPEIVLSLLERGENLHQLCFEGENLAFVAAEFGHLAILEILIERGIGVNHISDNAETVLFKAVSRNDFVMVSKLLEGGADINFLLNGISALSLALEDSEDGNDRMASFLVINGANVNLTNEYGHTLIEMAYDKGCGNCIVNALLRGAEIEISGRQISFQEDLARIFAQDPGSYPKLVEEISNAVDVDLVFDANHLASLLFTLADNLSRLVCFLESPGLSDDLHRVLDAEIYAFAYSGVTSAMEQVQSNPFEPWIFEERLNMVAKEGLTGPAHTLPPPFTHHPRSAFKPIEIAEDRPEESFRDRLSPDDVSSDISFSYGSDGGIWA